MPKESRELPQYQEKLKMKKLSVLREKCSGTKKIKSFVFRDLSI